jgi:hypothetical protein
MSEQHMDMLQGSITQRQYELHKIADILARAAHKESKHASIAKVLLIFLGAFTATKGASDQIFSAANILNIMIYTIAGLLVATIAGLEAAFKFESRSAELKVLAATCQSIIRQVDSQWQKEIGTAYLGEQIEAARKLIDLQDAKLAEIQEKTARLGVNITLEIRELYRDSGEKPYLA